MGKNNPTICIAGHHFIADKSGGVELQTYYIGKALARSGWSVAFLCPSLNGKSGSETIGGGLQVWRYPAFSLAFQAPKGLLKDMLGAIEPKVFYQRGRGHLRGIGPIRRYSKENGVPLVFALSSDADLDSLYEARTTLKAHKPLWKRIVLLPYELFLDAIMRKVILHSDYLVGQHQDQITKLMLKFNRRAHLIRTIHLEIEQEPDKSDDKIVLWVANYRPRKQGALFVRLAEECAGLSCHFVMVYGKTKKEYIQPVLQAAQGKENLTICGEMAVDEIERLMEKSILFVNTSEPGYEGFPNTFVQSWLRETPTVSLSCNPGRIITGEKIGMCSRSFPQLVRDVKLLVERDEERLSMGKRARAYAENAHGFERNIERISEYFSGVLKEHKCRALG